MTDLDPAVEAAERAIGVGSTLTWDRARWFAERAVAAAAPLIRAQVAEEIATQLKTIVVTTAYLNEGAHVLDSALRICREHATQPTTKES